MYVGKTRGRGSVCVVILKPSSRLGEAFPAPAALESASFLSVILHTFSVNKPNKLIGCPGRIPVELYFDLLNRAFRRKGFSLEPGGDGRRGYMSTSPTPESFSNNT